MTATSVPVMGLQKWATLPQACRQPVVKSVGSFNGRTRFRRSPLLRISIRPAAKILDHQALLTARFPFPPKILNAPFARAPLDRLISNVIFSSSATRAFRRRSTRAHIHVRKFSVREFLEMIEGSKEDPLFRGSVSKKKEGREEKKNTIEGSRDRSRRRWTTTPRTCYIELQRGGEWRERERESWQLFSHGRR